MKWALIAIGIYMLYRIVKGAAPPEWPTDEEAKRIIAEQNKNQPK